MGDAAPGYTEAMAELERILHELEHDDVDVDRLADRVARAAQLIELCRDRIRVARMEVERITVDEDPNTEDR